MTQQRQSGIPLAAVLLMVGICAVLAMVTKTAPWDSSSGLPIELNPDAWLGAAPAGGFLALIVTAYTSRRWSTLLASYVVGGLAVAVGVRLLDAPHNVGVAIAGSTLLIVYGLVVRLARPKAPTDPGLQH